MRLARLACFVAIASLGVLPASAAAPKPLTIKEIIESATVLQWRGCEKGLCYSPDKARYVIIVGRGDVGRNGIAVQVLTGDTRSLDTAKPRVAAELFTPAYWNPPVNLWNDLVWLPGNKKVAFLWEDAKQVKQVMLLDLDTGALEQLTDHKDQVQNFTLSPDGSRIAYTSVDQRNPSAVDALREKGFAVGTTDALAFFRGNVDGWDQWLNIALYVRERGAGPAKRVPFKSARGVRYPITFTFSPNGRDLLATLPLDVPPADFGKYTDKMFRELILPQAKTGPVESQLLQLYVIDAVDASVRPLWSAPYLYPPKVVWSPDGARFLLGPAFLPTAKADELGLAGAAVADVETKTGKFAILPLPPGKGRYQPVRWVGDVVEVAAGPGKLLWFEKDGAAWKALAERPDSLAPDVATQVRLVFREDRNTPLAVYAVQGTDERMVYDPNPQLRGTYALGKVEEIEWSAAGRQWKARFYYPVKYVRGRRYPLVVQTHGDGDETFSLIGDNNFTSVFAAQALANRGIAVVQMDGPVPTGKPPGAPSPAEAPLIAAGMNGVVEHLVKQGIVDGAKVGVSGFSRTGWHVEYLLTHTDYPYAAAIVADNMDANYMQSAFKEWPYEQNLSNGGTAFGAELAGWLERAPAFSVERMRTPLRMQVNSGALSYALTHWEMLSRLTYLKLPVELYIPPKLEQGTHNLTNPSQVLASAGGAVDWYNFWLNGHEDKDPAKAEQYARWRKMRALQVEAVKRPRPPLLKWSSSPAANGNSTELDRP